MIDNRVRVGFAPTRRRIFSVQDALRYKALIADKMRSLGIDFVDIEDVNSEGLLRCADDVQPVIDKFRAAKVDALFIPHCNFGSEHSCGKVARALGVPVLLWGPRDEAPLADGSRLRDSQCGLFATGKALRRMQTPFTYLPNCGVEDDLFREGLLRFIAVANVVKEFRRARILQIDTRPNDFWSVMCSEGDLLERFGIQVFPVTLIDLVERFNRLVANPDGEVEGTVCHIHDNMEVCVGDEDVLKVAALKAAMKALALENGCNAIAIQCWDSLQTALRLMPCCANALLTEEGLPVACETDIHGTITSIIVEAASMGASPSFFVDWSVRHPENDNGELLQHCGPWPISLAKGKAKLDRPFAFEEHCPGAVVSEIRGGEISIMRFDGDNGSYGMLMGTAKGIEGPKTQGTYLWVEVPDWPRTESMLVRGPYIHHASCVHGNILPIVYEALAYLPGVRADFFDDGQERATKRALYR
ncbi:MAG: fucose isomerase [Oscillospiraceae bacterium]|jgi:L-fucose isomerase-like protein|nr:fucose isomerase [Oscillospiraceae bacterium]